MKFNRLKNIFKRKKKVRVSSIRRFKVRSKRKINKGKVGLVLILLGSLGILSLFFIQEEFLVEKSKLVLPSENIDSEKAILARSLSDLGIEIKGGILDNGDKLVFELRGGGEVVFSRKKSLEKQAASLQVMLERFKIEGRRIKKIDMGFQKPIIR